MTLLHEQETVWGILGSLLIASGVVTVNGAKNKRSNAHATFEHPSLLPMFQYRPKSTGDRNAIEDLIKADKSPLVAHSGVAGISAVEDSTVENRAAGSGFLQSVLSRLRHAGLHPLGSFCRQQAASPELELAGVTSEAESGRRDADDSSAASSDGDGGLTGQPIPGPALYTSLPQQEDRELGRSHLSSAGGDAAADLPEKRRLRGQSGGVGSLRDGEKSWVGEWAFRREIAGNNLAPAMARYHQLLEQSRQ